MLVAFAETSHSIPEVSQGTTLLFAAILVGLISCLALEEKIHAKKSVIAGIFAPGAWLFKPCSVLFDKLLG